MTTRCRGKRREGGEIMERENRGGEKKAEVMGGRDRGRARIVNVEESRGGGWKVQEHLMKGREILGDRINLIEGRRGAGG